MTSCAFVFFHLKSLYDAVYYILFGQKLNSNRRHSAFCLCLASRIAHGYPVDGPGDCYILLPPFANIVILNASPHDLLPLFVCCVCVLLMPHIKQVVAIDVTDEEALAPMDDSSEDGEAT